jgi:hypothetical protein
MWVKIDIFTILDFSFMKLLLFVQCFIFLKISFNRLIILPKSWSLFSCIN